MGAQLLLGDEGLMRQVRLELLRPAEIGEALAINPTVYMPLGTIEWHCTHLPVGLDGLTAQGVCERAASTYGGLVYPALYFGTGGGHGDYPWTVMMPEPTEIRRLIEFALHRFEQFKVRKVVLFTGHFAPEQLGMIADIERVWNATDSTLTVVARGINMAEGLAIDPDHAGMFETSMLYSLWPDRVDLTQLEPLDPEHPVTDDWEESRHNPDHPLWGVIGPDPRNLDPDAAEPLLDATARWLAAQAT